MILLTGASGFLGGLIKQELKDKLITTIGRKPNNNIICNLSGEVPDLPQNTSLVIHAAGKAHSVPKTEADKTEFFDVNVEGTRNLLKGLSKLSELPRKFVFISSVAVYGLESGELITEDSPLLAQDPYGKSKIQAEEIIEEWCKENNVVCTILRLPLLAGPHPPGNLGAMIKGIKNSFYFNVAGGKARKSMVLAEDVAKIIPVVAEIGGIYNLTDRHHPSFNELSLYIAKKLNKSKPKNIPLFIAQLLASIGSLIGDKSPINRKKLGKIISDLTFDDSNAVKILGWDPKPILKGFNL